MFRLKENFFLLQYTFSQDFSQQDSKQESQKSVSLLKWQKKRVPNTLKSAETILHFK